MKVFFKTILSFIAFKVSMNEDPTVINIAKFIRRTGIDKFPKQYNIVMEK